MMRIIVCMCLVAAAVRGEGGNPLIRDVSLTRKSFAPANGESVGLKIDPPGGGAVSILDPSGNRVRRLPIESGRAAWDGRDGGGRIVPAGAYTYAIECADGFVYDPYCDTYGFELSPFGARYEAATGRIGYTLPKAAIVRICIGLKAGPLLRTLVDWEPREAGANAEPWDGRDESGLMDLSRHSQLDIAIAAYSLAANTIIVRGERSPALPTAAVSARRCAEAGRYSHALHAPGACREPSFALEIADGAASVRGTVPVRVTIDARDRASLENARFEIVLYVDGVFLWEEENGVSPTTYLWRTEGLGDGPHILTANVYGFNDHIGAESRSVPVKSGGR